MTEQLLDRADVVTVLKQVGRERVPKGMAAGVLRDPGTKHGLPDSALKDGFVQMVPPPQPAFGIEVDARRGEHPLPGPFAAGVRILPTERMRQRHPAGIADEVALVLAAHGFEAREGSFRATGNIVRRSRSPLPARTMISLRAKSTSFTRSRRHSRRRRPLP